MTRFYIDLIFALLHCIGVWIVLTYSFRHIEGTRDSLQSITISLARIENSLLRADAEGGAK